MRTYLIGLGLFLSLALLASPSDARLRVIKGKGGSAFKHRGSTVSFSAVQRGQQRLGPYTLSKDPRSGALQAKRSWTFGKTKAEHTRSFTTSGSSHGYNRTTGDLTPGHRSRVKGRNQEQGNYNWVTSTTQKPFQILTQGTNGKGPLKASRVQSGPYGVFSKHVYRDGRPTEVSFKPRGSQLLALPAPPAK